MSSATFIGANPGGTSGFCPAPPPPPPPPTSDQVPTMRISTTEPPMSRRPQQVYNNDPYEPPAAIQNAMMTKDKKPFTYTPGMGGKLDLSQIRSPRMARRVAKNANDEGIEGPPKSPLAAEQPRPVSTGANLFVQPQVAVPVFPTNPPAPQVNRAPQIARAPTNVAADREPPRPTVKIDQKPPSQLSSPETPSTPTQVTLIKAPTPWMQNKSKQRVHEELPEWAKRSPTNGSSPPPPPPSSSSSSSSSYSSGDSPNTVQTIYIQQPSQEKVQAKRSSERIIPLRVEDRPSVFAANNESGPHQFKQSSPHRHQRWGQPVQPQSPPARVVSSPSTPSTPSVPVTPVKSPQTTPGTFIVPIVVEGSNNTTYIQRNDFPNNTSQNQVNKNVQVQKAPVNQQKPGPVQSQSFRVLQKITDTDKDDIDAEQLRKLQLTEDDKVLMNKFKEQVDGDSYLHQEEDPRYRGAAIPSRAFRYLQNMTDSNEVPTNANVPRAVNSALKKQNRNSRSFEESQMNLPPSEQQVPEPKKYTGSAIPSRSFRILQAMTTPEAAAMQEIGQADLTCQVSSMPLGNQQGVFVPHYSQPIYWAYYPISYPYNQSNYHQLQSNNNSININVPNANAVAYYNYQDNASFHDHSPAYYPLYHYFTPNGQSSAQEEMCANSSDTLAWVGIASSQSTKHSSQCSDFTNIDKTYSMNILHEEDDCDKKIDTDDVDRSTNDDNVVTDSQESSSDGSSGASDCSSVGNPPSDDEIEVETEATSSDDDSDSYLAYSTGRSSRKESKDKFQVSDETEDKQNTDCESYMEDEVYSNVKKEDIDKVEEPEEPPDNVETTVSVSLPLRLKYSMSADDEDVTTVIVGGSQIKTSQFETHQIVSEDQDDDENNVLVHFKINNNDTNACANFTLRKNTSIRPKSWCPEVSNDFCTTETIVKQLFSPNLQTKIDEVLHENDVDDENMINDTKIPEFEVTADEEKTLERVDESTKNKCLLTVQNSREETDDDDSGVTSDMSRLISEVDTDSECTPSRKLNSYSRTQTHSRLFRLLTDDLVAEESPENPDKRNQLSLRLKKSNRFSYPNNSNTQDSFQKSAWLNSDDENLENKDKYFKTWKEAKFHVQEPIVALNDKKLILWPYKLNVLCPRIKSGKNIPKILEGRVSKPVHPVPSCIRYDRC